MSVSYNSSPAQQPVVIPAVYVPANFTANGGMTWTVDVADILFNRFQIVGKVMTLFFVVSATTIGGVPNTTLIFTIPAGRIASGYAASAVVASLNLGASQEFVMAQSQAGTNQIWLTRMGVGVINWPAGVNAHSIFGTIILDIL